MEGGMALEKFRRFIVATIASLVVAGFAGAASANGGGGGSYRVLITCPAGQDGNGDTVHGTGVQIRNVSSVNHAFLIKSVKLYSRDGALLANAPAPDPFPVGLVTDLPAHAATVASVSMFLGNSSATLLSMVFDVEVHTFTVPYFFLAVHLDLTTDGSIASRDAEPCVVQKKI
jgi:hypothetical protein